MIIKFYGSDKTTTRIYNDSNLGVTEMYSNGLPITTSIFTLGPNNVVNFRFDIGDYLKTNPKIIKVTLRVHSNDGSYLMGGYYLAHEESLTSTLNAPLDYFHIDPTEHSVDITNYFKFQPTLYFSIHSNVEFPIFTHLDSSHAPEIIIESIEQNANHENDKYVEIDNLNCDLENGRLGYQTNLFDVNDYTPLSLNLFYDVNNKNTSVFNNIDNNFPKGFRTNFHQFLYQDEQYYVYYDGVGDKHIFRDTNSNNVFYDIYGTGLVLEVNSNNYQIKNLYNSVLTFNSSGLLTDIVELNHHISINYTNGHITSISNNNGHTINFTYNTSNIVISHNNLTKATISFNEARRLSSITKGDVIYNYSFDSYLLTRISDSNNGNLFIEYNSAYFVRKIEKKGLISTSSTLKSYVMKYYHGYTMVTDNFGVIKCYSFSNGKFINENEVKVNEQKKIEYVRKNSFETIREFVNETKYINCLYGSNETFTINGSNTYNLTFDQHNLSLDNNKRYVLCFKFQTSSLYQASRVNETILTIQDGNSIIEKFDFYYVDEGEYITIPFKTQNDSKSISILSNINIGNITISKIQIFEFITDKSEMYVNCESGSSSIAHNGILFYRVDSINKFRINGNDIVFSDMTYNDLIENQKNLKKGNGYIWYSNKRGLYANVTALDIYVNDDWMSVDSDFKLGAKTTYHDNSVYDFIYYDYHVSTLLYTKHNIKSLDGTSETTSDIDINFKQKKTIDLKNNNTTYCETNFTYDSDDNITNIKNVDSINPGTDINQDMVYNANKNLLKEIKHIDSADCITEYTYDNYGRRTSIKNPLNQIINYSYNSRDVLTGINTTVNNVFNQNTINHNYELVSSLNHNSFGFNFEYDSYNLVNNIKIGLTTLLSIDNYITSTSTFKTIHYSNGYYVKDEYDKYGRLYQKSDSTNNSSYTDLVTYLYSDNTGVSSLDTETTNNSGSLLRKMIFGSTRSFLYDQYKRVTNVNNTSNYYSNLVNTYDSSNRLLSYSETKGETVVTSTNTYMSFTDDRITNTNSSITYRMYGSLRTFYWKNYYTYDNFGRIKEQTMKQGTRYLSNVITYKNNCNLIDKVVYNYSPAQGVSYSIGNATYTYDDLWNITNVSDTLISNNISYVYDNIGRLIRENNQLLNKTCIFEYDSGGNIIKRKEGNYTTGNLTSFTTYNYSYDSSFRDRLYSYNGNVNYYDNMGNPTIFMGRQHIYTKGRLLSNVMTSNGMLMFTYDKLGSRTKKYYSSSKEHKYVYDNSGNLLIETITNNGSTKTLNFVYVNNELVGFTYEDKSYFYHKNIQGDIIGIYNSSCNLVAKYAYDAWGKHKVYDSSGTEIPETNTTFIGHINPFRYRSYYYDVETKYYYLKTRYYVPEIGRFLNMDSVEYLDPEQINGLNLYAYCLNNPVMYSDGDGNFAISSFLIGLAVSSLIGWGLSQAFGSQIAGGIGSCINGAGAIYTGVGLLSFGPVGWIAGGALMLIGAGTMAFGVNDIVTGATGTNYIQSWTGMSDDVYFGINLSLNIASTVGTIAGNIYMKYNPRYPGNNPSKIPDGFNNRQNPNANYYNPRTKQSLHPDLNHPKPIGPHWDWKDSNGVWWRLYRFWRIKK